MYYIWELQSSANALKQMNCGQWFCGYNARSKYDYSKNRISTVLPISHFFFFFSSHFPCQDQIVESKIKKYGCKSKKDQKTQELKYGLDIFGNICSQRPKIYCLQWFHFLTTIWILVTESQKYIHKHHVVSIQHWKLVCYWCL